METILDICSGLVKFIIITASRVPITVLGTSQNVEAVSGFPTLAGIRFNPKGSIISFQIKRPASQVFQERESVTADETDFSQGEAGTNTMFYSLYLSIQLCHGLFALVQKFSHPPLINSYLAHTLFQQFHPSCGEVHRKEGREVYLLGS